MTFGRIVYGSAGSIGAEAADIAGFLAVRTKARVDIAHAGAAGDAEAKALEAVSQSIVADGIAAAEVGVIARHGNAADAVAAVAEEVDAGLIVVGRGGDNPSHIVHRLSHEAPCDLLVVAERSDRPGNLYARIAVATDGSATADRAARRGFDLARVMGADVDLVFVGHQATGELISQDTIDVYGEGVDTAVHLREGDPATEILAVVSEAGSDLVVVGNKGLAGLRGALLASVPKGVLDGAAVDVLVCRTVRQMESQLEPGEGGIVDKHGERLAVFRDVDGELFTMSARCTHLGCVVDWNPAEATFDCPCHGSRFDGHGAVVSGPAARPLPPA